MTKTQQLFWCAKKVFEEAIQDNKKCEVVHIDWKENSNLITVGATYGESTKYTLKKEYALTYKPTIAFFDELVKNKNYVFINPYKPFQVALIIKEASLDKEWYSLF